MSNGINIERQQNNFDFLRVFATLCVTYTHSFNHANPEYIEHLHHITGGKVTFADVGLCIFFSISGYLIVKSAHQSASLKNFLWKRVLRIQPMLVVVCLLSVFLLGPFFTTLGIKEYFAQPHTWTYFRNIMPIFGLQYNLPAVFGGLSGETGVNGSIWTLIVEERLYLVIALVFFAVKERTHLLLAVTILFNSAYITSIIRPGFGIPFFDGGALFYAALFLNAGVYYLVHNPADKQNNLYILVTALFVLVSYFIPSFVFLNVFAVPLLVINLAAKKGILNQTGRYGDFTYGIYVFSFPVQQVLSVSDITGNNPYSLFALTLVIVVPAAVLSWHLIEKKMLLLKNRVQ